MNKISRIVAIFALLVTAAFASVQSHQGTTFDAPVVLTTDGPEAGTTTQGTPYTETVYESSLQNDDTYLVAVSEYGFQIAPNSASTFTDGFASGINGEVKQRNAVTVSGVAAESSVIEAVKDGRTIRFYLVTVPTGNKVYAYAFGTWMDTQGTDLTAVRTFFTSISIQ